MSKFLMARPHLYVVSGRLLLSTSLTPHPDRRRHLPGAHPLRACGLSRPVLDRKRDQRVPARAAARERGVFEGASFAICTLPSYPSATASSSRPSGLSFPCRPSDSFPRRPYPPPSILPTHRRLRTLHLHHPHPPPPHLSYPPLPSLPLPSLPFSILSA
jgi:hypothetical protein